MQGFSSNITNLHESIIIPKTDLCEVLSRWAQLYHGMIARSRMLAILANSLISTPFSAENTSSLLRFSCLELPGPRGNLSFENWKESF